MASRQTSSLIPKRNFRQVLPKDGWDELKPLIYQLYIQEGKTFNKIQEIFAETYGFSPTLGQFKKRLTAWGFRKYGNTCRSGKQLTVERREHSNDSLGTNCALKNDQSLKPQIGALDDKLAHPLTHDPSEPDPNDFAHEAINDYDVKNHYDMRDGPVSSTGEANPELWDLVDVPGSPQLSRLFSVLSIDNPDTANRRRPLSTIEPLSLSKLSSDICEEFSNGYSISGSHNATNTSQQPYSGHTFCSQSGRPSTKRQLSSLNLPSFWYNSSSVLFPTRNPVSPTPWNEIYPFPVLPQAQERFDNSTKISDISMSSLKSRANRLQAYIGTLANLFPPSHPMILKSMEDLADNFSEMGQHSESSIWWKLVVARRESFEGAGSPDCLNAMYQLILTLQEQGDRLRNEIETLGKRLEILISQSLSWEHKVAVGFLRFKARAFLRREQWREGEELFRQILQIRLTQLGPRHTETIQTMSSLSLVMSKRIRRSQGRLEVEQFSNTEDARSSESLMCAAVQLFSRSGESYATSQGQIIGIRHMALLAELGYLEEATHVAQTGAQRFKEILGESHPTTIEYLEYIGHLNEQQGRFQQSIDAFRKVLSLQEIDETMGGHIDRYEGLGKALKGAKQHQEALIYLNKTFQAWHSMHGALHFRTKTACYNLGHSYSQVQQYNDALQLYHRYTNDIRAAAGGEHPLTLEVSGWVSQVEELSLVLIAGTAQHASAEDPIVP